MSSFKIGIIGCGFVGSAIHNSLTLKGLKVKQYDKFKYPDTSINDVIDCSIIFLCLPTPYSSIDKQYNKESIYEVCGLLKDYCYNGLLVLKSTVEPGTTLMLIEKYNLQIVHNPEFLTAKTALEDFHNQKQVIIGSDNMPIGDLILFYKTFYDTPIHICKSTESEMMKLTCNNFYSVKIQFFNEIYLLCEKLDISYNRVKDLVLTMGWTNPMHTTVPGPDGKLSYGGFCFPKDTNALNDFMESVNTPHLVLDSVIKERNVMRDDHLNCT